MQGMQGMHGLASLAMHGLWLWVWGPLPPSPCPHSPAPIPSNSNFDKRLAVLIRSSKRRTRPAVGGSMRCGRSHTAPSSMQEARDARPGLTGVRLWGPWAGLLLVPFVKAAFPCLRPKPDPSSCFHTTTCPAVAMLIGKPIAFNRSLDGLYCVSRYGLCKKWNCCHYLSCIRRSCLIQYSTQPSFLQ